MRDILTDLECPDHLSDPDPVRRAQIQMRTPLPKRFYKDVSVAAGRGRPSSCISTAGRCGRRPRPRWLCRREAAATLVADEFAAQGETIDPISMPVMRLANTAIDGVAAELDAVIEDIERFSSSDLVCLPRRWAGGSWPSARTMPGTGAGLGAVGHWRALPPRRWRHPCASSRANRSRPCPAICGRARAVPRCRAASDDVADGLGPACAGRGGRGA